MHIKCSAYHPSSNGRAERFVQTVKHGLIACHIERGDGLRKLDNFPFAYRLIPSTVTGKTPSELFLGRQIRSRLDVLKPHTYIQPSDTLLRKRMMNYNKQMELRVKGRQPVRFFHEGDHVLVRNHIGKRRWMPGVVGRNAAHRTNVVGRNVAHRTNVLGRNVAHRTYVVGRNVAHRTYVVGRNVAHRTYVVGRNVAHRTYVVGRNVAHRTYVVGRNVAHRTYVVGRNVAHRTYVVGRNVAHHTYVVGRNVAHRTNVVKIGKRNVKRHIRLFRGRDTGANIMM